MVYHITFYHIHLNRNMRPKQNIHSDYFKMLLSVLFVLQSIQPAFWQPNRLIHGLVGT